VAIVSARLSQHSDAAAASSLPSNGADFLQRCCVPGVWIECASLDRLPALLIEPAVSPLKLHRQHLVE
jgi:hypothetical protein